MGTAESISKGPKHKAQLEKDITVQINKLIPQTPPAQKEMLRSLIGKNKEAGRERSSGYFSEKYGNQLNKLCNLFTELGIEAKIYKEQKGKKLLLALGKDAIQKEIEAQVRDILEPQNTADARLTGKWIPELKKLIGRDAASAVCLVNFPKELTEKFVNLHRLLIKLGAKDGTEVKVGAERALSSDKGKCWLVLNKPPRYMEMLDVFPPMEEQSAFTAPMPSPSEAEKLAGKREKKLLKRTGEKVARAKAQRAETQTAAEQARLNDSLRKLITGMSKRFSRFSNWINDRKEAEGRKEGDESRLKKIKSNKQKRKLKASIRKQEQTIKILNEKIKTETETFQDFLREYNSLLQLNKKLSEPYAQLAAKVGQSLGQTTSVVEPASTKRVTLHEQPSPIVTPAPKAEKEKKPKPAPIRAEKLEDARRAWIVNRYTKQYRASYDADEKRYKDIKAVHDALENRLDSGRITGTGPKRNALDAQLKAIKKLFVIARRNHRRLASSQGAFRTWAKKTYGSDTSQYQKQIKAYEAKLAAFKAIYTVGKTKQQYDRISSDLAALEGEPAKPPVASSQKVTDREATIPAPTQKKEIILLKEEFENWRNAEFRKQSKISYQELRDKSDSAKIEYERLQKEVHDGKLEEPEGNALQLTELNTQLDSEGKMHKWLSSSRFREAFRKWLRGRYAAGRPERKVHARAYANLLKMGREDMRNARKAFL